MTPSLPAAIVPHVPATRPATAAGRAVAWADAALGLVVALPAAVLVVAEVLVLLAGIVSRGIGRPLVWTDELASMLFLWLAMLGAVVALRRGEHMRMTALVSRAGPATRAVLEALAVVAAAAFLLMVLSPGLDYASDQAFILTPALQLPDSLRAAALPVGALLMLATALLRLARTARPVPLLAAVLLTAALVAAFWWLGPVLRPLGRLNLLVFFVGVVAATVLAGVPIAFCFGLATFGYLALTTRVPVSILVGRMDEGMSHLILLAVPLFVLLGTLMEATGMARAMIRFLAGLLGHVQGGLSYVLVAAMYLVSGISGAKAADMAAVAPVLFPEMRARGARPGELVALLAATGAQTETVPPSLVLITIGSVTGVSISALFTGGLLPSAVLALLLCAVVWRRNRAVPDAAPTAPRAAAREVLRAFVLAIPALVLPVLIRAVVVGGIATATEVSTLGILYCLVVGTLLYRGFPWRRSFAMLVDTAALSGAILLIIGTATGMAWALTQSGFSRTLAAGMAALPGGRPAFLAVSVVAFVILGSVLEGIPAVVLFGPLLFPIARTAGVDEVHYAMVVVLAMGVGLFTPPFGVGYYAACAIGRVNPDEGMRPIWGYMAALLLGLALVAAVPWLSTGFL